VCDARNWDKTLLQELIGTLPSQSTMSRRLRTVGVQATLERVMSLLAEDSGDGIVLAIDSKPLKVGSYSKDREALRGRAAGEMARGYKLHAITRNNRCIAFQITAMNTNDQVAAARLIPRVSGGGYLVADNGYDANALYRTAAAANYQLVAPPRMSNAGVRDARRNTAERLRSLDMLDARLHAGQKESFGRMLMRHRKQIERNFGHAVMLGLHAPPPWVRGPRRVATWTACKLIQSATRLSEIEGLKVRGA
jgi:hypothetical protein